MLNRVELQKERAKLNAKANRLEKLAKDYLAKGDQIKYLHYVQQRNQLVREYKL